MQHTITMLQANCRLIALLLVLTPTGAMAQTNGQLAITSYDKSQAYYFCDSVGQTSGQNVIFALVNLTPGSDLIIDSFRYECDRSVFDVTGIDTLHNFDVGAVTTQVAYYTPHRIGSDTLRITAYYGAYSANASIVCHAIDAPPISFYGVENVDQDLGFGIKLGVSDEILTQDTLHDEFLDMTVSDTPINLRKYCMNPKIVIRTCGERTIDRIYRVGDTTEISLSGIPPLPYTMHSQSALVLSYSLTPKIPGNTPHYLVIHTTDGDNLVWSFEYRVRENNAVSTETGAASVPPVVAYPNPVRSGSSVRLSLGERFADKAGIKIFDAKGVLVSDLGQHVITSNSEVENIGIPTLSAGSYLLLIQQSSRIEAVELIVTN
ncbi:MAG: T9SS type A sorting domain-containing protein [Bacteroidetes bacterium]|nr:T9SS type A sorting domain-containing protein [Bacteroidota bacterium]